MKDDVDRLQEAIDRADDREARAAAGENLTLCVDCGIDAWEFEEDGQIVHEDFYVSDDLWDATCPDDDVIRTDLGESRIGQGQFMICIGCFEKRLGRQLVRSDFKVGPSELGETAPSSRFRSRWTTNG